MFWFDFEGMGAEIISLRLKKVGWQVFCSVPIVEAERSAESWSRDTPQSPFADNISPAGLCLVDGIGEELVKQQILKFGVFTICSCNVLQKNGSNDTSSSPHQRNGGLIEFPLVLFGSLGKSRVSH